MKSCFFIGHREISEEIFSALTKAVEHHIVHCGVTEFIVGNYGGFDRMAARAVIPAKALYPGITLLLLLSYTGFTERIRHIFRLVISRAHLTCFQPFGPADT